MVLLILIKILKTLKHFESIPRIQRRTKRVQLSSGQQLYGNISFFSPSPLLPSYLRGFCDDGAVSCELRCCGVTRAGPCTGILYIFFLHFYNLFLLV